MLLNLIKRRHPSDVSFELTQLVVAMIDNFHHPHPDEFFAVKVELMRVVVVGLEIFVNPLCLQFGCSVTIAVVHRPRPKQAPACSNFLRLIELEFNDSPALMNLYRIDQIGL